MPRVLSEGWIAAYLEYTKHHESTPLYHIWCGISTLAGAMRNNVFLDRVDYNMYPNIYVFLVGESGTGKSTACKTAFKLLAQCRAVRTFHGKISKEAIYDEMNRFVDAPGVGTKRDSSIYFMADEAKSMLGGEKYAEGILETLTDLYGGEGVPWTFRTKKSGSVELSNYAINFLGASTAQWLGQVIEPSMFDAGPTARFLWVVNPDPAKKINELDPESYREQHAIMQAGLINDLKHISLLQGQFAVTPDALGHWTAWRKAMATPLDPRLHGYFQRRHDYVLKLAMILSVSASDDLVIKIGHIKGAIELLEVIEQTMVDGFRYIGSPEWAVCGRIEDMLKTRRMLGYAELLTGVGHMVRNKMEFDGALRTLVGRGAIKVVRGNGDKRTFSKGTPSSGEVPPKKGRKRETTSAESTP